MAKGQQGGRDAVDLAAAMEEKGEVALQAGQRAVFHEVLTRGKHTETTGYGGSL